MNTGQMKQLFCLPYAGGNASFYNHWKNRISSHIELVPIEYSGHGSRMNEPLKEDASELIEDICTCILGKKRDVPFGLFGYSMGAKLCMSVVMRIFELTGEQPETMFLGAATPPHIPESGINWKSDDELYQILYQYGGMPMEVLMCKELCDLFLPIIKADMSLSSKICVSMDRPVCDSNLYVLYAPIDDPHQAMGQWVTYTTGKCTMFKYDGTHFFINDHENDIISLINRSM